MAELGFDVGPELSSQMPDYCLYFLVITGLWATDCDIPVRLDMAKTYESKTAPC